MSYRAVLLAVALALGAPAALAADRPKVSVADPAGDAGGGLDIVLARLALGSDGRLRGEVTMSAFWNAGALRGSGGGPPASVCVRLYTRRDPKSDVADYLVCATPAADGEQYVGQVLRERRDGPPKRIADAAVSRPTTRTIYLRFTRTSVKKPDRVRFAAEVVVPGPQCSPSLGCRDTAPDAPKTVPLSLHPKVQDR
jgi:hypothetical protein